jgi:hypothetical protein
VLETFLERVPGFAASRNPLRLKPLSQATATPPVPSEHLSGLSLIPIHQYMYAFPKIHWLLLTLSLLAVVTASNVFAQPSPSPQQPATPLTSREVVTLVYQLPRNPELRDEIVAEIRRRGIGFPLTDGMRSVVASKSGNDALLRRTLEEAERRRVNPTGFSLPSSKESEDLLERTRVATLAAAEAMPDFIVKQLVRRSRAYGDTNNWQPQDNLTLAVGYRANVGEEYRVLAVNGIPLSQEARRTRDYSKDVDAGATSSGVEYISALAGVFKPESKTTFTPVDTDVVRGRRTLVYEYEVKKPFSQLNLRAGDMAPATVGSRGRLWIDRETNRVVRFEQIASEVPYDYPITAARSVIDYDWIAISEKKYMLPIHSEVFMTMINKNITVQSRNEIRFRGYQKFGAELKVIDEIDEADFPPEKP